MRLIPANTINCQVYNVYDTDTDLQKSHNLFVDILSVGLFNYKLTVYLHTEVKHSLLKSQEINCSWY